MPSRQIRWLGCALSASTGAGLLAMTSTMNAAQTVAGDLAGLIP
jgi:hypothetical protein